MSRLLKVPLKAEEVLLDQPLPWPVYGPDGELLLNPGDTIKTQHQRYILLTRGLFREATAQEARQMQSQADADAASPFKILATIRQHNHQTLLKMVHDTSSVDLTQDILKTARLIQKLCTENRDAVLGAIILDQESLYTQIHPILCALLTELLLRRKNVPGDTRQILIAAALTQNLGMLELQNRLSQQTTPLSPEQKQAVQQHPLLSVQILQQHGIGHQDWLQAVENHHEKPDGSGYPKGLTGEDINLYARILSLADIYSAMVLPRQYRDGFFVKKVLQDIFLQRGASVDKELAELLIKEVGIYPPGAFVKLVNGDTAIVAFHGQEKASLPVVLPLCSGQGKIYPHPQYQNTALHKNYRISQIIARPKDLQVDLNKVWRLKA